jgi:hypothetical protein
MHHGIFQNKNDKFAHRLLTPQPDFAAHRCRIEGPESSPRPPQSFPVLASESGSWSNHEGALPGRKKPKTTVEIGENALDHQV